MRRSRRAASEPRLAPCVCDPSTMDGPPSKKAKAASSVREEGEVRGTEPLWRYPFPHEYKPNEPVVQLVFVEDDELDEGRTVGQLNYCYVAVNKVHPLLMGALRCKRAKGPQRSLRGVFVLNMTDSSCVRDDLLPHITKKAYSEYLGSLGVPSLPHAFGVEFGEADDDEDDDWKDAVKDDVHACPSAGSLRPGTAKRARSRGRTSSSSS